MISEKFISKFEELQKMGNIAPEKLFRATVDALELEGVRLLATSEEQLQEKQEDFAGKARSKHVSLRELFSKDSPTPSDKVE